MPLLGRYLRRRNAGGPWELGIAGPSRESGLKNRDWGAQRPAWGEYQDP